MIHLPKWLKDSFEKSFCPYCKEPLVKKGVIGVGMREEHKKNKKPSIAFCYEYKCPGCKNRSVFTGFQTDWEEFVADIIEVAKASMPASDELPEAEADTEKANPKQKKSGISPTEVQDALRALNDSTDLKEFFFKLGIIVDEKKKDESQ